MELRAAIVGCGNIAGGYDENAKAGVWTHAGAIQQTSGINLVAAVDPDLNQLRRFQKRWKVPLGFETLNEMAREATPDVVIICSPNRFHVSQVKQVIQFPVKAVICEKPMAPSYLKAVQMVQHCSRRRVPLLINYPRRWDQGMMKLGRRFSEGREGKIQGVRVLYTKGVFHNASHFINLLTAWFGDVTRIGVFRREVWERGDFRADFFVQFMNGVRAAFQACDEAHYDLGEIEVFTSKSRWQFLRGGREIRRFTKEAGRESGVAGQLKMKPVSIQSSYGQAMERMMRNLVRAVQNHEALQMESMEAAETIRICEQIKKSPLIG